MKPSEALQQLQIELPAVFAGTSLDALTGNAYRWRTLQNEKSLGIVPDNVFMRSGDKKLLVIRDPFLEYWATKLKGTRKSR